MYDLINKTPEQRMALAVHYFKNGVARELLTTTQSKIKSVAWMFLVSAKDLRKEIIRREQRR